MYLKLVIIGYIKSMSSYLTIYLVPKGDESKPISLISYSRNNEVYQYFNDTINPAYIGVDENVTNYTELTEARIKAVISELKSDIDKAKKRVAEYEKHAAGKTEIIEDILSQKEWIDELQLALSRTEFIEELVYEASHGFGDYTKVLCNID